MIKINDREFATVEELEQYAEEEDIHIDYEAVGDDDNVTLVEVTAVNPENGQRLRPVYIPDTDEEYEEAKIQLTQTSRYHDWHNTVADRLAEGVKEYIDIEEEMDRAEEEEEKKEYKEDMEDMLDDMEDILTEYNKNVDKYNQYGDKAHIRREDIEKDAREVVDNIAI